MQIRIKDLLTFSPPKINLYQLISNGKECGEIFKCQGYYWLQLNECRYSACAIGFGSAGIKYPIFDGYLDRKYNPTSFPTAFPLPARQSACPSIVFPA